MLTNVYESKILDSATLARYNGRVNLFEQPDPKVHFSMLEKVGIKNKATEYRAPLTNEWEETDLSRAYFSAANVQILQNGIRAGVYEMSKKQFIVMPQNVDTLKVIMRSIYLQYAEHRPTGIAEQISTMNKLVLDYAVPSVYNEAVGYMKYMEDVSTLARPIDRPTQVDRNFKTLESHREFFHVRPEPAQDTANINRYMST